MKKTTSSHLIFCTKIFICLVFLGGMWSGASLPWEKQKKQDFPSLQIVAKCPKIATDMQKLITVPIEESIRGIPFVSSYFSTTKDFVSTINVNLKGDINNVLAAKTLLISTVRGINFPTKKNVVLNFEDFYSKSDTIFEIFLSSSVLNFVDVSKLAKNLSTRLGQITQIGKISVLGVADNPIQLDIASNKLQVYGISYSSLYDQIQQYQQLETTNFLERNYETPSFFIENTPISIEEINKIRIYGTKGSIQLEKLLSAPPQLVTLRKDLAIRINQQDGIQFLIHKKEGTSTVETVNAIQLTCDRFAKEIQSADLSMTIWKNSAIEIKKTFLSGIAMCFLGGIFASIVTILFWGISVTSWSVVGTIFSFLLFLCGINFFESTLYFSTIYGLFLSSGLMFCTCVLTTKMFLHRQNNFTFFHNIFFQLKIFVVITAGLIPLYYCFYTTHWIKDLPLYFIGCLGSNFITCGIFLPILLFDKSQQINKESKVIQKIIHLQKNILKNYLQTKKSRLITFWGILSVLFLLEFFQKESTEQSLLFIKINGDFYKTSFIVEGQEYLTPLETFLTKNTKSLSGDFYTYLESTEGHVQFEIFYKFPPNFLKKEASQQFIKDLQKEFTLLPMLKSVAISSMNQNSINWKKNDLYVEVTSDNDYFKNRAVWNLAQYLRDIKYVIQVNLSDSSISENISIEPNVEKISSAGISIENVQKTVQDQLDQMVPSQKIFIGKNYVFLDPTTKSNIFENFFNSLQKVQISPKQSKIHLQNLVKIYKKKYPNTLTRINGKQATIIKVTLDQNNANFIQTYKTISLILKNFAIEYPEVGFSLKEKNKNQETFSKLLSVFILSTLTMFLSFLISYATKFYQPIFFIFFMWIPFFIGIGNLIIFPREIFHLLGLFYAWIFFTGFLVTCIFYLKIQNIPFKEENSLSNTIDTSGNCFISLMAGFFLPVSMLAGGVNPFMFIFERSVLKIILSSFFIPILVLLILKKTPPPTIKIVTNN